MERRAVTWHYGLIAQWWAEFNQDGDEIGYFQRLIESCGQPALDLGCGTGRLLIPYLQAGLDVDGCDVSTDMLAHCERKVESLGLSARLYTQAMHELDLPRKYRTIILCGSFGLGGDRRQDLEGLARMHAHLEPGGVLAFDVFLPNAGARAWRSWLKDDRPELPAPWPERGDRKRAADDSEIELKTRVVSFDPLEQIFTREMRAERWKDGELLAREEHMLESCIYFKSEIVLMLQHVGFGDIRVNGGLSDLEAKAYDDTWLMFIARKA